MPSTPLCTHFVSQNVMSVSVAKFERKGETVKPGSATGNKKRKKKVLESLERQALSWEGFDDKLAPAQVECSLGWIIFLTGIACTHACMHELSVDSPILHSKLSLGDRHCEAHVYN